ncbi:MAG: xylann 1,4-beta-xylosidase [Lachnospiraceae bacterium]|nr:xylann 1,4-beta-xylosidase [Lachnospiraceae bacterium]
MNLNFQGETTKLPHTWSVCVGAGRANEGLRADWQAQLRKVHRECGFRYLRFHGLFHDDMHVYTEENGAIHYNFQYVDQLFDALLEEGVRPFVELSFMPEALCSNDQTLFWWKARVAPPNDLEKWADLVGAAVEHWLARYGKEEVCQWYFEVWNEPNLNAFWSGSRTQYYDMYRATSRKIKSIDPDLKVGGPATSNYVPDSRFDGDVEDVSSQMTFQVEDLDSLDWHGVWIKDFLDFCAGEKLPVDFVSCHPYPTDFALDGYGESRGRTRGKDSILKDVLWVKREVENSPYPNAELHLTEWSSSPSSRDYSHDYLPAAAYVMRSNLKCAGLMDCLSYWTFTDIFEEVGAGPKAFHGGFGMLNLQGVQKPVFHAYRILHELGEECLAQDEGWVATRKNGRLNMAFYHYPESYGATVPMSMYPDQTVARQCQDSGEERHYAFTVAGLRPGDTYTLCLLKRDAIPVVLWNQMGAPVSPAREQTALLRRQGEAMERTVYTVDDQGCLSLEFTAPAWTIGQLI